MCRDSSDWCAKEKECRDSEGKRVRSSLKTKTGEGGPESNVTEGAREAWFEEGIERFNEEDRLYSLGEVDLRDGGFCRMRRRPLSLLVVSNRVEDVETTCHSPRGA